MAANSALLQMIQKSCIPIHPLNPKRHDSILQAVGNAKIVMIGEASHGTHEFYYERAEITKRLIQEKGFTCIAVEADWPDAYKVNRFVRGIDDSSPEEALGDFKRFPRWMWRNTVVMDFIKWLRNYNDSLGDKKNKCGFYGMDLYSLFESANAVVEFLSSRGFTEEAKRAKERYACFDRFNMDTQAYGYATSFGFATSCQRQVTEQLVEMLKQYGEQTKQSGFHGDDEIFYARENARVVRDAEEYYRSMFTENTWNMRDKHMVDTLKDIIEHFEGQSPDVPQKVVVWAHNSHLGDASATDSSLSGQTNVGELVRKQWGLTKTFNIGFTTFHGTVAAADNWDEPVKFKKVRPALANSYEFLFHQVDIPNFDLLFRTNDANVEIDKQVRQELEKKRLERAIGVIYRPDTERASHYFHAKIPQQFDAVIHIDKSRAIKPLDRVSALNIEEHEEETWPFGL